MRLLETVDNATGYEHPGYAAALAEFGAPRLLPRSGGWILQRQIPGFDARDAMGCYPLFVCRDWSALDADLEEIGNDLVSLTLVADPFGAYDTTLLKRYFSDLFSPFKEHFVVDLSLSPEKFVCAHHRRNARKALRELDVERCTQPTQFIDQWHSLYTALIQKHDIRGIATFSKASFAAQIAVPGVVLFRTLHEGTTVGMTLWYLREHVAYYHLGAYSDDGYHLRASFALFWRAIEYFAACNVRWLSLGAGAGLARDDTDGLSRFKRGWATATRTAYLCGKVFDRANYQRLAKAKAIEATGYFPAYRKGEFH